MFGVWWGFIFRPTTPWTPPPCVGWAGPRRTPGPPSGPACARRTSATWCQMVSDHTWHVTRDTCSHMPIMVRQLRSSQHGIGHFYHQTKPCDSFFYTLQKTKTINAAVTQSQSQHSSKSAFYVVSWVSKVSIYSGDDKVGWLLISQDQDQEHEYDTALSHVCAPAPAQPSI